MRYRLNSAGFAAVVAVLTALPLATSLHAQKEAPKKIEAKAEKFRGAAGAPEVSVEELNAAGRSETFLRPPAKGGTRTRGAAWHLFTYDNYTRYWVNCYYNRQFGGTVAPYGALTVTVSTGDVTIMCYAPGTNQRWGPRTETVVTDASFALYE